ncbi:MAG: AMP-binding protein, partial [Bryobacterales bacterium]|nr:AMP-binding protein [Bryobacteraceae bacterium]MDW8131058.1 AMP-binding protein [Bryobacterales bacterium]
MSGTLRTVRDLVRGAAASLLSRVLYRIQVTGRENIPRQGPVLLVASHVSCLDAFLISCCLPPSARFLLDAEDRERLGPLARLLPAIPLQPGEGLATSALEEARAELVRGGIVAVFGGAQITRTGHLMPFRPELEKLWAGTAAAIVPVHLEGMSGAWLSYRDGRLVRRPPGLRRPAVVSFGKPLGPDATVYQVQQSIVELAAGASGLRFGPRDRLERRFIRSARRHWKKLAVADSTGRELSFGRALIASMLLAGWLRRRCGDQHCIGILLPATAGAAIANFGVLMAGKVPVNLNFTAGRETMETAIAECRLRTILTSRTFLEKAGLPAPPGGVLLEELTAGFGKTAKLATALLARLVPVRLLERLFGGRSPDDTATIIFSSGSTGEPKGVVLSHRNIISNIESLRSIFRLRPDDRVIGVLPFFHVFGFTCVLCFPLAWGYAAIYHPNPTDARTIGELTARYQGTLLLATPTFFGHYLRRCEPEEFRSLRYAIAGGEKLPAALAGAFREKFGIELLEGYGLTETSPVVAVNVPDFCEGETCWRTHKPGTVGRPIPGVAVRILDPSTGAVLPQGQEGVLAVKGPCVMRGYLGQPERTREVLREGWYLTGDIGSLDEEGFLSIADRLSRFSKIGGEMVPHGRIEQTVSELLGGAPCAVMAVPDPERGERLVVLYTARNVHPAELWRRLQQSGLPKLWIPKQDNFYFVEELPP